MTAALLFIAAAVVLAAAWLRLRWPASALAAYVGVAALVDGSGVGPGAAGQSAWSGAALLAATAFAALATARMGPEAGVVAYAVEIAARSAAAVLLGGLALAGGDGFLAGFPPRGDGFLFAFLGAYLVSLTAETARAVRDLNAAATPGRSGER